LALFAGPALASHQTLNPLDGLSHRGVMAAILVRLPERSLAIALLRRGAFFWLLVRLLVMSISAAVSGRGSVRLLPTMALALALGVGALGLLDARRRNEHRFLANLGVSQIVIAMLSTIPALLGELALGAVRIR
jgi:hypothetical protein